MARALDVHPDVNVSPYASSQPVAPGIQILPPGVEYDVSFNRGLDNWTFTVQGFVSLNEDISTQQLLDEFCASTGSGSVKGALEADRTLGGTCETLHVISQSPGVQVNPGGSGPMLLVEWRVMIYANGG